MAMGVRRSKLQSTMHITSYGSYTYSYGPRLGGLKAQAQEEDGRGLRLTLRGAGERESQNRGQASPPEGVPERLRAPQGHSAQWGLERAGTSHWQSSYLRLGPPPQSPNYISAEPQSQSRLPLTLQPWWQRQPRH